MATGLEVAATILQFVDYGQRSHNYLAAIRSKAKDPQTQLGNLSTLAQLVITLVESLDPHCHDLPSNDRLIQQCMDEARGLLSLLDKIQSSIGRNNFTARIRTAATWERYEEDLDRQWLKVDRCLSLLKLRLDFDRYRNSNPQQPSGRLGFRHFDAAILPIGTDSKPTLLSRTDMLPSRNKNFVGRETVLRAIKKRLESTSPTQHVLAVVGLGGSGKSALAIEYGHRFMAKSAQTLAYFLTAHSETDFELKYSALFGNAETINNNASLEIGCRKTKNFLESERSGRWLIIVDSVDNIDTLYGPKALHKLLPRCDHGSIIFTCRSFGVALDLVPSSESIIRLERLDHKESLCLLRSRLGPLISEEPSKELIEMLEGLPLALLQAASFIAENCETVQDYVNLYCQSDRTKIELLSRNRPRTDEDLTEPISRTWHISFENIEKSCPLAARMLSFGSCIHSQEIPATFLCETSSPVQIKEAVGLLKGYSMITTEGADGSTFNMHPLVHLCHLEWLRDVGKLRDYRQLALQTIRMHFPDSFEHSTEIASGDQLSLHAERLIASDLIDKDSKDYLQLASNIGKHFRRRCKYAKALEFSVLAAKGCEKVYGERHPETLAAWSNLVVETFNLGKYVDALRLGQKTYELRTETLGAEHPDTLASLNDLGIIAIYQGQYQKAEDILREAVAKRTKTLGPENPDTWKSQNNLALSLKKQERFEAAETIYQDILRVAREGLGKHHTGTIILINNLGLVQQLQGNHEEALMLHSEALRHRTGILGADHVDTWRSKLNIAVVNLQLGKSEDAEATIREVLGRYDSLLGKEHTDTVYAQQVLASTLLKQHKYKEASRLAQEIHQIRQRILGEIHPDTMYSQTLLREIHQEWALNRDLAIEEPDPACDVD